MDSATSRTAARIMRILPRERISRALGHLTEARVPAALLNPVLALYTRAYNVDLAEAEMPPLGFASFNEFFTRRLRNGLRPIDPDPAAIVSPADGLLDDTGPIDPTRSFVVKGQAYDAAELLASPADAAAYAGGHFAVVYLSPRDYHRVHAPLSGEIVRARHIPGTLFPVNKFGVRHVPLLFARNERVVVFIETAAFGTVAVVLVGAMIVGKITLAFDGPRRPPHGGAIAERAYARGARPVVSKGEELGAFQLGSTVVLLVPPAPSGRCELLAAARGHTVRLGEPIARRSDG